MDKPPSRNHFIETIARLDRLSAPAVFGLTFAALGLVFLFDYATGFELSCTVFYLLPIGIAAWLVGGAFGILLSLLSTGCNTLADFLTGRRYASHLAPLWNPVIVLSSYLIFVWLLRTVRAIDKTLRQTNETLDQRVRERTASLASELAERKRLEKEVLVISEREQQRIGRDIHDSLCQHLMGTAFAEQCLAETLAESGSPEAGDADRVVTLIEDAISMARGLAAGLSPIEKDGEGLLTAFTDLAVLFSVQFKVACRFDFEQPVLIRNAAVATHLYRIAQEAVHNAIRHGRAQNIRIRLGKADSLVTLSIEDDGAGLPADFQPGQSEGMGLRNMQYRASMIGGSLILQRGNPGTIVTCSFRETEGEPTQK